MFFGQGFFDPYNTPAGQAALLIIGAFVLAGIAGLVALGSASTRRRCFPAAAIRRAGTRTMTAGRS